MKAFNYYAPTEIIFGCGRVQEIGSITAQYGKKALLVTVPEFPEVKELYEKVKKSLRENGVEVVHFDGVIPNPTTDVVTEGANMAKAAGVDVVIGLGGGSSIDTAKAIAVEATHPGTAWDYNCHTPGPTSATLPIIAIGTTAGTGSQCTQCAVITKTSEKDKSAIWHKNIFFEAYLSVKTSPLVEMMAIEAIKMIKEYLPKALENPNDIEARSKMSLADTLGGLTNSNAGVTLPHGLGMQVGGHAPHVSHGQALAIIYPQFTRYTYAWAIEKFAKVGRIFNPALNELSDEEAAKEACVAIDDFLKKIGLWIGFKDVNVTKEQIREIADDGQVLGDYLNNPRVATIDEMYELLMNCYERKE